MGSHPLPPPHTHHTPGLWDKVRLMVRVQGIFPLGIHQRNFYHFLSRSQVTSQCRMLRGVQGWLAILVVCPFIFISCHPPWAPFYRMAGFYLGELALALESVTVSGLIRSIVWWYICLASGAGRKFVPV